MASAPTKSKTPPLGSGQRFAALKGQLSKRAGVTTPGGLAAFIGQKRYSAPKMAALSAAGRKRG